MLINLLGSDKFSSICRQATCKYIKILNQWLQDSKLVVQRFCFLLLKGNFMALTMLHMVNSRDIRTQGVEIDV